MARQEHSSLRQSHQQGNRVGLTLLGEFAVRTGDGEIPLPMSAQRVLAFLALHERPVQRAFLAASLWLDSPETRAFASLRSALWRLRRPGEQLVRQVGQALALADDVEVDLRRSTAEARGILDGGDVAIDVDLLARDLLPDWYDDWLLIERERHRQLRLSALEALCDQLAGANRLHEALDAGLAAVAGDPLRESSHRALVRVHLAHGNVAEAVRQYDLYRRLLSDNLGLEPSERMEELIAPATRR